MPTILINRCENVRISRHIKKHVFQHTFLQYHIIIYQRDKLGYFSYTYNISSLSSLYHYVIKSLYHPISLNLGIYISLFALSHYLLCL